MDVRSTSRRIAVVALLGGLIATPIALGAPGSGGNGGGARGPGDPGVSVSGLTAGAGAVDIREYIDLGTAASGQAHRRIAGDLVKTVAAAGLGSITLRPLAMSTDLNSTEAGQAVVAAGNQNMSWVVTAALIRAQAAGGDWINPQVLKRIASRTAGLNVRRFLRDAGAAAYPQLNAIKQEAMAAGVTVTPAFVVRGPRGTRLVSNPGSTSEVINAITSVR